MGYIDTVTKEYMRENTVFADAFNYLIYDGEQVVDYEISYMMHFSTANKYPILQQPIKKMDRNQKSTVKANIFRAFTKMTVFIRSSLLLSISELMNGMVLYRFMI